MSNNGTNRWKVSFSHISWLEKLLSNHANVENVSRHDDLVFEINRNQQADQLTIFCCNEYTMGMTMVQRAIHEFGELNLIYIGGGWCGYTNEAKKFCLDQRIGLYVTDEMSGALWRSEFWSYQRKDTDGDPIYHIREP